MNIKSVGLFEKNIGVRALLLTFAVPSEITNESFMNLGRRECYFMKMEV